MTSALSTDAKSGLSAITSTQAVLPEANNELLMYHKSL
jgi:hypothetical protein